MKLKIFNLLTASLATLGLLVPPTSAFGSNIAPQTSIKEAQPLKGDIANNWGANREWTQNQRLVQKDKSVAVASRTSESLQPNLARQTPQSKSLIAEIFVTSAIVGFILGCLLQYKEYKKERTKRDAELLLEIETLEKIRRLEIENSEKIQNMKSDIDQIITPQRQKQIETLERIWNIKT